MTVYRQGEIIFTRGQIEERAAEIGRQITADYAGKEVFLIGILTGCVQWMAELMKSIELDTTIDFMSVSSYGKATHSSGIVKIIKDLNLDIKDRHVIIVEDIVDSGVTLDYLRRFLMGREPATLKICAMLDKPAGRRIEINADYVGFTAPNVFLIGYGLDANQKFRNLPYIAAIAE
jgi:hypoxanthine phosphoribosyltransferase